jgi:ankyrin repeat protein
MRLTRKVVAMLILALSAPAAAQSGLHTAARDNDTARISALLERGVDIETRDSHGRTALMVATHANAVDAARVLMAAGADVNARDDIADTPYLYAGAEGRLEILRLTVASDADLASVNRYGGTALIPAAHHGHVETVRFLLTTAVDIDHVNNLGWTALLEAVILGDGSDPYVRIVELLLRADADYRIPDRDGVTALEHAQRSGQTRIAALLRSAASRE